jgi:ABC-type amino acid transport system permease subunit
MAGARETVGAQEDFMIPLIAITIFFLIFMVLVGLIGRRAERQREEKLPTKAP